MLVAIASTPATALVSGPKQYALSSFSEPEPPIQSCVRFRLTAVS